jgi:hypothetical protein
LGEAAYPNVRYRLKTDITNCRGICRDHLDLVEGLLMRMLVLALAFVAGAPPEDARTIPLREATALPANELARRLLPSPIAGKIAGGVLHRRWLPGQVYTAVFWEPAIPVGSMLCRRIMHGIELSNASAPGDKDAPDTLLGIARLESGRAFASSYPARATSTTCAQQTGYISPRAEEEGKSLQSVARLVEAMTAANVDTPLPFKLSCKAEDGDNACVSPRVALANLPLGALFGVEFEPMRYRTNSVTPIDDGKRAIVVRQSLSGSDEIPIAAFGASGPDKKSWRVRLVGAPGALQEVHLQRTSIVYH